MRIPTRMEDSLLFRVILLAGLIVAYALQPIVGVAGLSTVFGYIMSKQSQTRKSVQEP